MSFKKVLTFSKIVIILQIDHNSKSFFINIVMLLQQFLDIFSKDESHIVEFYGANALEQVNHDGLLLMYVKKQTKKICLAAVKQNGYALQYVKEQTEEVCLAAVRRNISALQYVDKSVFS